MLERMVFKHKVAVLFAAGVGTALLLVPASAFAAPKSTKKITITRDGSDPTRATITWLPVDGAHHYNVSVFDGSSDNVSVVPAGTTSLAVTTPDPCTRLRVNVGSRDVAGRGATSSNVWLRSLAPGGVSAPRADRDAEGTAVTVSWKAPAWGGHGTGPAYRVVVTNATTRATVAEAVVDTPTATIPNLDAKTSYTVGITATNTFGSCSTAKVSVGTTVPNTVTSLKAIRDTANPGQVKVTWAQPAYVGRSPVTHYIVGYGATKATKFLTLTATSTTVDLDAASTAVVTVQAVSAAGPGRVGTVKVPVAGATATPGSKPGTTIEQKGAQIIVRLSGKIGAYSEYPKLVVRVRSAADTGYVDEQWGQNGAQTLTFGEIPAGSYLVTVSGANATGEEEWSKRIVNIGAAGLLAARDWKIISGKPVIGEDSVRLDQRDSTADVLTAAERSSASMALLSTVTTKGRPTYGVWLRATEESNKKLSGYLVEVTQRTKAGSSQTESVINLRIQSKGQRCGTAVATAVLPATATADGQHRLAAFLSGDSLYVTLDEIAALDVASLSASIPAACTVEVPSGTRAGVSKNGRASAGLTFTRATLG